MGGRAEGLACADPGARTPIGASGILFIILLNNLCLLHFFLLNAFNLLSIILLIYFINHSLPRCLAFNVHSLNQCIAIIIHTQRQCIVFNVHALTQCFVYIILSSYSILCMYCPWPDLQNLRNPQDYLTCTIMYKIENKFSLRKIQ